MVLENMLNEIHIQNESIQAQLKSNQRTPDVEQQNEKAAPTCDYDLLVHSLVVLCHQVAIQGLEEEDDMQVYCDSESQNKVIEA